MHHKLLHCADKTATIIIMLRTAFSTLHCVKVNLFDCRYYGRVRVRARNASIGTCAVGMLFSVALFNQTCLKNVRA